MRPRFKREYRETVHLRYRNATGREKTAIMDEFCVTCGGHRKHAIKVLKGSNALPNQRQRKEGNRRFIRMKQSVNP